MLNGSGGAHLTPLSWRLVNAVTVFAIAARNRLANPAKSLGHDTVSAHERRIEGQQIGIDKAKNQIKGYALTSN